MKKLISLALILTMIVSIFAFNSSAAGLLAYGDLKNEAKLNEQFYVGAYSLDEGKLVGYSDAMCIQTLDEWYSYDSSVSVILNEDDLYEGNRGFSLWYPNTNLETHGLYSDTVQMVFGYSITNQEFSLTCVDIDNPSEEIDLVPRVAYTIEDDKEYTFGMSVSRGRLRGFINNTLVLDYVDTEDKYLIGLDDGVSLPTCHVFWNSGNFAQITEIQVATAEYFYPIAADDTVPVTSATNAPTATTAISQVVVTDDDGNAVTNADGEKVTDTVIITEAPADTHTGTALGGNAASTGDNATIVVALMIAALGSALIIRKVYVK